MRKSSRSPAKLLAFLLCGASLWPAGVAAQTVPDSCLASPTPSCIDAFNTRLVEIEATITDVEERAWAQLGRVGALAFAGRFDEAEAIIATIVNPPNDSTIRDQALSMIIMLLDDQTKVRGRTLLDMIETPQIYESARAFYISDLSAVDFDLAVSEIAATARTGEPLSGEGFFTLGNAAVSLGKADIALRLIKESIPKAVDRDSLIFNLASRLTQVEKLDEALKTTTEIDDQSWRAKALTLVAAAFAKSGNMPRAEKTFEEARAEMATLADAKERESVFQYFIDAALASGRVDLAVAAAKDVGSFPLDMVASYSTILRSAGNLPEETWRPIADQAIAILKDSTQLPGLVDESWFRLAQAVAVAGDAAFAAELVTHISDKTRRAEVLFELGNRLIANERYQDAMTVIAPQTDRPKQLEGLILLMSRAREKMPEIAEQAYRLALGLVEVPDSIDASEDLISSFAFYESSTGLFQDADTRYNFLSDPRQQISGKIHNLENAAVNGTEEDFRTYLAKAQEALEKAPDADTHRQMFAHLLCTLFLTDKIDEAIALAYDASDPVERDFGLYGAYNCIVSSNFQAAMQMINLISDPALKLAREQTVLVSAIYAAVPRE